jgi:hypothetical protein
MPESSYKTITSYGALRESSPAWRLLASQNGPHVLAILKTHLFDNKDERVLKSSVLAERVRADMDLVREGPEDFPRSAEDYIDDWVAKRYLVREYLEDDDEERLWLSAPAVEAVRFADNLASPRSTVTESRLAILTQALGRLSIDADKDSSRRLERLLYERERLDREIEDLKEGRAAVITSEEGRERSREIISLGKAMVDDFGRVREQYQSIHQALRQRIVESDESQGAVLNQVFSDIRRIHETDAGRTFNAFYSLLRDEGQRIALSRALDVVAAADFFQELDRGEQFFLKNFIGILFDESAHLNYTTVRLSESLHSYVSSREFKERRTINRLIQETLKTASELSDHVGMGRALEFYIELTSAGLNSISRIQLREDIPDKTPEPIRRAEPPEMDLTAVLMSVSSDEIDFQALKENVLSVLEFLPRPSIGDVLHRHPAAEGLGSVVGLMHLASRFGEKESLTETVSWMGLDEIMRSASIEKWVFLRERRDEITA